MASCCRKVNSQFCSLLLARVTERILCLSGLALEDPILPVPRTHNRPLPLAVRKVEQRGSHSEQLHQHEFLTLQGSRNVLCLKLSGPQKLAINQLRVNLLRGWGCDGPDRRVR